MDKDSLIRSMMDVISTNPKKNVQFSAVVDKNGKVSSYKINHKKYNLSGDDILDYLEMKFTIDVEYEFYYAAMINLNTILKLRIKHINNKHCQ